MTIAYNRLYFHEASKENWFTSFAFHSFIQEIFPRCLLCARPSAFPHRSQENVKGKGVLLLCGKNERDSGLGLGCIKSPTASSTPERVLPQVGTPRNVQGCCLHTYHSPTVGHLGVSSLGLLRVKLVRTSTYGFLCERKILWGACGCGVL